MEASSQRENRNAHYHQGSQIQGNIERYLPESVEKTMGNHPINPKMGMLEG